MAAALAPVPAVLALKCGVSAESAGAASGEQPPAGAAGATRRSEPRRQP